MHILHHVILKGVRKGKFLLILECLILTHLKFSQLLVLEMNPMPTFLPGFRSAEVSWGLEFASQILAVCSWGFYETIFKNLFLFFWYSYPVKTHNSLKIKLTFWTPAARVPSRWVKDFACFAIPSVPRKSSFLLIKNIIIIIIIIIIMLNSFHIKRLSLGTYRAHHAIPISFAVLHSKDFLFFTLFRK